MRSSDEYHFCKEETVLAQKRWPRDQDIMLYFSFLVASFFKTKPTKVKKELLFYSLAFSLGGGKPYGLLHVNLIKTQFQK
jgi:hypothetical protein